MKKAVNNIIINQGGKILIIKRTVRKEKAYPGLWDLPGGGVEEGETLQETAKREAMEEVSLEIKPVQDCFYVYHYEDKDLYVYGMISETNSASVTLSEAHTEFKWISKDEYKNFEYTLSVTATIEEFFNKNEQY
ncbi:MAG: NUDIX hydrolase [bacterium]